MKQKKIKWSVLLLGIGISVHAQQAGVAAGGEANGSNGNVAYTVGQVSYTTLSGSSGTISQGVQQVYEILTVGVKETELSISLSVFPNPTSDNLTLQIHDYNSDKLMTYQLFDSQGKLINTVPVTSNQTTIDMGKLPSSTYVIDVIQENKKVKSFKIIKN